MHLHKNKVIIAPAGGKKTAHIVERALEQGGKRVLITTYTNENVSTLKAYIIAKNGCIPNNISVMSWLAFLLREGVRPYQNFLIPTGRVESIDFKTKRPLFKGITKGNPKWYLNNSNYVYKDHVSEFVCDCNAKSGGLVIKRLEKIFDSIFIDEMQDMAGWDQDFLKSMLESSIGITLVGDPRQATYATNNSRKNKATKGSRMVDWVEQMAKNNLCDVEIKNECFRGNQAICDFADMLYPDLPKTISKNLEKTGHDGVFYINKGSVNKYVAEYEPTILRYFKSTDTMSLPAINIGISKGRTYSRVLIFPTEKMKHYLKTEDLSRAGSLAKLYVAVTRAKYSVAFVMDDKA